MLSIKSAEVDWDLGGCGGRLEEQGWIYAVYPASPVCLFFFFSLEHTSNQMEYIQPMYTTTTHTCRLSNLMLSCLTTPTAITRS